MDSRAETRGQKASETDLVGVWQLVSFHDIDDSGQKREGPLGPQPRGLLFYSANGHMSVNMMRTSHPAGPDGQGERPSPAYMSYGGSWRLEADRVCHTISVAPDPGWVDTEQVRELVLRGDRLTLYGTALVGPPQRRVLDWQRIR
jgi:hypothetical protein